MLSNPIALGIALSAVGVFTWALHYILIRIGMDAGNVTNAVLAAMLCNLVIVLPLAIVFNYPDFGITPKAAVVFAAAGLAGGLFGRFFQYVSTDRIGASKTSPIMATAGLFSTVLAILVLGESVTVLHLVGILLVVVGVMFTSWETARDPEENLSLRGVGSVVAVPIGAAFFYGVEPILIKIGITEGTPYLVGMVIMISSALVGFAGYRRVSGSVVTQTLSADPGIKWYVLAGLAGTAAFLAYFAALEVAPVVVVIPIFQTVPVLVVVLSVLFMPRHLERVTWRVAAASVTVVVGATLVSLSA